MNKNCSDCAKPAKSYVMLRSDIRKAEEAGFLQDIPPQLILAVGIQESTGNRIFDVKDLQCKQNLAVAVKRTGKTAPFLLGFYKQWNNPGDVAIPKFRYEPSWKRDVDELIEARCVNSLWSITLHTSFGYFQKGMVWHLSAKPTEQWDLAMREFINNPLEQIRVCANDLTTLIARSKGDVRLALTRYNGGPKRIKASNYGNRVFDLYKHELGL